MLGETRNALLWTLSVGAVMAAVLALKLTLAGCRPPSPLAEWRSPSGHTVSATMVYGGLAAVLGWGVGPTIVLSTVVAALIGTSRVLLGNHTPAEAILGGGIGLIGATAFAVLSRPASRRPGRRLPTLLVPVAVLALAVWLHGTHLRTERLIDDVWARFWPLRACP